MRCAAILVLLVLAGCEDGCGINRDNHFRERDEYMRDKEQRRQQRCHRWGDDC